MKSKIAFFTTMLFFVFSSCNEEILEKDNPNEFSTGSYFENEVQAIAATNAVYAGLQTIGLWTREYYFVHDLLSDEYFGLGSLEGQRVQVLNHAFDSNNSLINELWRAAYRTIHRANIVIDNVPEMDETAISQDLQNRLVAEARFLRAMMYFELVSLWGDVPFYQTTATAVEATEGVGRTDKEEIYNLIFEDLAFAEQNLPVRSEESTGRATQGAAQGLAGRIHLWRATFDGLGQPAYEAAETVLQRVIDSGEYSLVDDYTDNFTAENENNEESLFEVQYALDFGGGGRWSNDGNGIAEVSFRGQEYGFKAWRNVIPSEALLNAFEESDPRYELSFYSPGDVYNNGQDTIYTPNAFPPPPGVNPTVPDDLPSWRKYQNYYNRENEVNQQSGINHRVLRYADVLLMMAEVQNALGNQQAAIDLLNQVRARPTVDMPPYPTDEFQVSNQEEVMDAIIHERRIELNGEQIRNRDIRRWRKAGMLEEEPIDVWEPRFELLPIPSQEIDANAALTNADQNPGF